MKVYLGFLFYLINKYNGALKESYQNGSALASVARFFFHPIKFWTQENYAVSAHMQYLINFAEKIKRESGDSAKCNCCLMKSLPERKVREAWYRSTYIFTPEEMFYYDKFSGAVTQLKLSAGQIGKFRKEFGVSKLPQELSDKQLYEITESSAHMHRGPELGKSQLEHLHKILLAGRDEHGVNYDKLTHMIFDSVEYGMDFNLSANFVAQPDSQDLYPSSGYGDARVLRRQTIVSLPSEVKAEGGVTAQPQHIIEDDWLLLSPEEIKQEEKRSFETTPVKTAIRAIQAMPSSAPSKRQSVVAIPSSSEVALRFGLRHLVLTPPAPIRSGEAQQSTPNMPATSFSTTKTMSLFAERVRFFQQLQLQQQQAKITPSLQQARKLSPLYAAVYAGRRKL